MKDDRTYAPSRKVPPSKSRTKSATPAAVANPKLPSKASLIARIDALAEQYRARARQLARGSRYQFFAAARIADALGMLADFQRAEDIVQSTARNIGDLRLSTSVSGRPLGEEAWFSGSVHHDHDRGGVLSTDRKKQHREACSELFWKLAAEQKEDDGSTARTDDEANLDGLDPVDVTDLYRVHQHAIELGADTMASALRSYLDDFEAGKWLQPPSLVAQRVRDARAELRGLAARKQADALESLSHEHAGKLAALEGGAS